MSPNLSNNLDFPDGIYEYDISIDRTSKQELRNELRKNGLITITNLNINNKIDFSWQITEKGKQFYFNIEKD